MDVEKILEEVGEEQYINKNPVKVKKVCIVGFAPDSRMLVEQHYSDPDMEFWGLNELYMDMPKLAAKANRWYQLHGYEPPQIRDVDQVQHLAELTCPVVMWKKHPKIPNSVEYPLQEILDYFDNYGEGMAPEQIDRADRAYFTNSVSWMITQAILEGYDTIYLYGVNMAQIQEFGHQRPSVEFYLGWAGGRGIKIYVPPQSDILMCPYLYGRDNGSRLVQKLFLRDAELEQRINELQNQENHFNNQLNQTRLAKNQMIGARENNTYITQLAPVSMDTIVGGKDGEV